MKIGIFTDIHLNKFSAFCGVDGRKRLEDGLNVLNVILNTFIKKRCSVLIFMGDWFHTRRTVDIDVINSTIGLLSSVDLNRFKYKFAITGNHDWYDNARSRSNLNFLTKFGFNVVTHTYVEKVINGIKFDFIPWLPTPELVSVLDSIHSDSNNKSRLLFLHTSPIGSSTATGYTVRSGIDLSSYSSQYDFIFCGDIHKRQMLSENIVICGAPMHHNFGDCFQDRGIHIFDTDTNKLKFISLANYYPEFIVGDVDTEIDSKNYYRIITSNSSEYSKYSNVQVVGLSDNKRHNNIDRLTGIKTLDEVLIKYCETNAPPYCNIDRLIDIGRKLML